MQVEARLIRRTQGVSSDGVRIQLGEGEDDPKSKPGKIAVEFKSWARLFSRKFIDRTWIGILMMVFQRTSVCVIILTLSPFISPGIAWHRGSGVLVPNTRVPLPTSCGLSYIGPPNPPPSPRSLPERLCVSVDPCRC